MNEFNFATKVQISEEKTKRISSFLLVEPPRLTALTVLTGSKTRDSLEQAGEMVREVETKQAGGLADVMTLHQQTFRLIDDVMVDVANGRASCGLVDDVAKIAGRIGQLGGAPGNGGQALRQLAVFAKIGLQQVVKALQQVGLSPILLSGESSCA